MKPNKLRNLKLELPLLHMVLPLLVDGKLRKIILKLALHIKKQYGEGLENRRKN